MKKLLTFISVCVLFPACAWYKSHPVQVQEAEQVAEEAGKELVKKEMNILMSPQSTQAQPAK